MEPKDDLSSAENNNPTVIVSSTQDPASTNIKSCLLELSSWKDDNVFFGEVTYKHSHLKNLYLITISDKKIFHEHLDVELRQHLHLQPSRFIFISRHRSKSGEPTITTHPIGNYGLAEFGGLSKTLTRSLPYEMARLLRIMYAKVKENKFHHHVCYEVTHHGPFLRIPTMFAEVGSDEREWANIDACRVVAQSVLDLLVSSSHSVSQPPHDIVLVGIGGGHYAPRFTELCLSKHAAFGHMIPNYHVTTKSIDKEMIQKAIDATPDAHGIYLHKKALRKSEVTVFKNLCRELEIPLVSSTELPDL